MIVRGVDYSHYQCPPSTGRAPDIEKMRQDGVEFVILKAWEGNSPDPDFRASLAAAQTAGMPAMGYVFLRPSDDAERMQACFDHVGVDTVLCLDWEDADVEASVVEAWMDAYEAERGRQGMVYYGLYPPDEPSARIGQWPRWFPEYCSPSSLKLPPWNGEPDPDWRGCWAIWQRSAEGEVDGIDGDVDLDELAPSLSIDELTLWLDEGGELRRDPVKPAIRHLQAALNESGYDAGAPDGLWGPNTQAAIDRYVEEPV